MKMKIRITNADEEIIRVASVIDNIISYKEAPNISVILKLYDDYMEMEKKGAISYQHTYKAGKKTILNYVASVGVNSFDGTSEVFTLAYNNEGNVISLKCLVNKEVVKMKWEVI